MSFERHERHEHHERHELQQRQHEQQLTDLKSQYKCKSYILLVLVFVDIFFNVTIDSTRMKVFLISFSAVQIVLRLVSLFIMFLLMSQTFVFQYGLLGTLCNRFRDVFIITPLSFLFTVAFRVYRVLLDGEIGDPSEIWDKSMFKTLFVLHSFVCVIFYTVTVRGIGRLSLPRFYKPTTWTID